MQKPPAPKYSPIAWKHPGGVLPLPCIRLVSASRQRRSYRVVAPLFLPCSLHYSATLILFLCLCYHTSLVLFCIPSQPLDYYSTVSANLIRCFDHGLPIKSKYNWIQFSWFSRVLLYLSMFAFSLHIL